MCLCWNKKMEDTQREECIICMEEITKKNPGYAALCCGNYYHNK